MDDAAPPGDGSGGAPFEQTARRGPDSSGSSRPKVRFTPGTMLGDRYRVVALLGKGGMGEVYRAEDLRLGQQVALKFLPSRFASDPYKLERLYAEVRLGRQVSHPNVCRLYDVAEVEGNHFIAMEYIDGEDLASLLRRIGKLPHEKALDLARDICAGLAAAHGLDIIHRDLKPANIMIDGRGDARITDFGLAALAEDLEQNREVAGTPAYMAPEQLTGGEISQKTDLYALGLILYEMFTGKRLFEGATFGEIIVQHSSGSSQSISRETATLDAAVQRVIVRCLDEEPAKRPGSIHSVIAALPGGDPLQAAIDAGETPSPEMVAAAGSSGELKPSVAWPLLIVTLVILFAAAAFSSRTRLYGQTDLPLEGVELAVRARQILSMTGITERPEDTVGEFGVDPQYRFWKRDQNRAAAKDRTDIEGIFSPLLYGYRESPATMSPEWADRVSAFGYYPPFIIGGMSRVVLESDGRLRRLHIVPPEVLPAASIETVPNWSPLFEAAGLRDLKATATVPQWRPPVGSDRRFAWLVELKGVREPVRVEAASLAGRVVWFEVFAPWRRAAAPVRKTMRPIDRLFDLVGVVLLIGSLVFGSFLASRNLRRGRGDRQGAFRLALFVGVSRMLFEIFRVNHSGDTALEGWTLMGGLSVSVFAGAMVWIWYLALEPYLRRKWPRTLISWNRLLQNRWLDARVGRDILIGILAGALVRLIQFLALAAPAWLGWSSPIPADSTFLELSGWKFTFAYLFRNLGFAVTGALALMVILLLAHLLLRRRALAIAFVFAAVVILGEGENYPILEWPTRLALAAVLTVVMTRYGLVALTAAFIAFFTFDAFPIGLDPEKWYFARSMIGFGLMMGLAVFGFIRALGAQALFGEPVLED